MRIIVTALIMVALAGCHRRPTATLPAEAARAVLERSTTVERSHAASVLALLEQILCDAGWDKSSVDAYAATRGPGSFTGLRVLSVK